MQDESHNLQEKSRKFVRSQKFPRKKSPKLPKKKRSQICREKKSSSLEKQNLEKKKNIGLSFGQRTTSLCVARLDQHHYTMKPPVHRGCAPTAWVPKRYPLRPMHCTGYRMQGLFKGHSITKNGFILNNRQRYRQHESRALITLTVFRKTAVECV